MILFDPEQSEADDGFPGLSAAGAKLPAKPTLSRYLREAQLAVGLKGEVAVLLTTDDGIRALNRRFRKKNKATDVLSFPVEAGFGLAGDLAISVETAARQAREQGHRLSVELRVLMLHGLLHLAGYDHEIDDGAMARKERRLRAKLGLPMGLIERVDEGAVGKQTSGAKAPARGGGLMYGLKPVPSGKQKHTSGVKTPVRVAAVMPGLKPRPTLVATDSGDRPDSRSTADSSGTANSRDTAGSRRTAGSRGTASSRHTADSKGAAASRSRSAAR